MNTTTNNKEINNNVINMDIYDTQSIKDFLSKGTAYPITFDPGLGDHYLPTDHAITAPKGYTFTPIPSGTDVGDDITELITITSRQGVFALLEDLSKSILKELDGGYYEPGDDASNDLMCITSLMHALTDYDDETSYAGLI